ncbi:hypothetical protein Lal_00024310 [Lupinus albus]|nr:hypothetical protein Lal_00024310 [Lupinus albus]
MKDGKCSKYFPKKFQQETIVDHESYIVYRRRGNRNIVIKNNISLYNRHYINKGYNKITVVFEPTDYDGAHNGGNIDEIKRYLDCIYVSPSEVCWEIFIFYEYFTEHYYTIVNMFN